ncbi:hypothetical protein HSACCH_02481 [Halanaerobium saccharolyticum subsp. saccharolyticum DSM 6643]|uniref:Outer membrane protein n=1 Tax=Halanaerobium saccharolyticum subsp. saccharolyticum DSM 6643 TaxID=1293054 RepID=M5E362_9FIRM|nr:hypothetical protein [Halanaerobium saccharolyticum]CCU80982.1 hypothetical protein HSACCH_02481 [Halanaerobium saccharolyticum subsp. saccharolyticum DSM 6643]
MKNRSKIFTFGLIVLIIFTGVIYAQNKRKVKEQVDKFEITENRKKKDIKDPKIDNIEEYNESELKTESDINTELISEENTEVNTEKKITETAADSENSSDLNSKQAAAMINLEELMAFHPETQELNKKYISKKNKLKAGENSAENIEILKENYRPLVIEKTKSDLRKFAEKEGLNLLLVKDKVVFGSKTEYQDLTEVNNQTDNFKKFLNK